MMTLQIAGNNPASSIRRDILALATCLLVTIAVFAIVIMTDKVIPSVDFRTHYRWLMQYQAALAEGTFYPRWTPLANLGLGELFYSPYPIYYYLASVFVLCGIEPWSCMKLLAATSNFLCGLVTYYGLKRWVDWRTALLGAVFIEMAPFPFFLFTHHAALPWQFSFPLAITLVLQSLTSQKPVNRFLLAFTVAVLTLTHTLVAFMTLLCLGLIKLKEIIDNQLSLKRFIFIWLVPVLLGVGLAAFHLLPTLAANQLMASPFGYNTVWINWRNSFVFPIITAWFWGMRWFTVQWLIAGVVFILLLASAYSIWRIPSAGKGMLSRTILSLCMLSVVALLLANEITYTLYTYIELLSSIQQPYRFLTVATIGTGLSLPLAIYFCQTCDSKRWLCLTACWAAFSVSILLLTAIEVQLVREGGNPNLRPHLLNGDFAQHNDLKTMGPKWKDYVNTGGFYANCQNQNAQCELILNKSQHRKWKIIAEGESHLVLPLFYFPGWTVYLNNTIIPFSVDLPTGLVTVTVPQGQHVLEIKLTGLPQERLGVWISVASLIGLVGLMFYDRTYKGAHRDIR